MRWRALPLFELGMAMAAVALLVAVAVPAWTDYVRRSRRSEAIGALEAMQDLQAQWRKSNAVYSATLVPGADASAYYAFTIPVATATRFVLRATATGDQKGDTGCTTLEIELDSGKLARRPDPDAPNCWRRN